MSTVVRVVSITPPRVSSKELAACTGLLMQICKWRLRGLVGLVAALQARIEQRSERLYVVGIWRDLGKDFVVHCSYEFVFI